MKKNVLAVCAVLSAVACFADCITIPLTEKSTIVTDGAYSDSEWETASMIGGFIQSKANRMVARDGDVYLTADKEALHVCVRWTVEGSETDGGFVTLSAITFYFSGAPSIRFNAHGAFSLTSAMNAASY